MNILKRKYAKVIDKITVEFAPKSLGGVVGFDNNESLCNANGYYFLKFSPQTGNTAVYNLINNEVIQSWVDIDTALYAQNVAAKIRERYSENEELPFRVCGKQEEHYERDVSVPGSSSL